ncbi:MAG: cysteine-rich KTR domain-containing protein [Oscillospiraceae bacterium]|nr:cysteine-rich KTR domain-containing protein [Clostridiales bacterium]MDD7674520.1 cysteine-rich KTR domain-containing protein [Oscillospiraceae bacterium]MDY5642652.1 cysteine-rich KTR domain-containing protein [Candidatus Faecousia sp.]
MCNNETSWVLCPACGGKTRVRLRGDTVLENFLLYCPKCRQEHLVSIRNRTLLSSIKI